MLDFDKNEFILLHFFIEKIPERLQRIYQVRIFFWEMSIK